MNKRPLQDSDVAFIHPSHPTGAASPVHTAVRMDQIAAFIIAWIAEQQAAAEPVDGAA